MLALPPLIKTAEDLLNLSRDRITNYMRSNYGERYQTFLDDGGELRKPAELETLLSEMGVGTQCVIWLYPGSIQLSIHRLDDDFYCASILWVVCNNLLAPWEVKWPEEVLQLYYAGIIWALVET